LYGLSVFLAAAGRYTDLWSTLSALEETELVESNPMLGISPSWKSLAIAFLQQISLIAIISIVTIYFASMIPYTQLLWIFVASMSFGITFSNIILKRTAKIRKTWLSWVAPMPIAGVFMVFVLHDPTLGFGFILISYGETEIALWIISRIHEILEQERTRMESIRQIGRCGSS
jgi:hypothetical protein